jgi:hypothetical protein
MKTKSFLIITISALLTLCVFAGEKNEGATAPGLKVHPRVFNLVECWISDSESPVVTEINLDAVEKNGNQFLSDGLTEDGGFMRFRVLSAKGNHYKIEYQENGGGSLTTASIIECAVEKREIHKDGKTLSIRVLRVLSVSSK